MRLIALVYGLSVLTLACAPERRRNESGPDPVRDAGADAGPLDAGFDAGPLDAGPPDGGLDAGPGDAGTPVTRLAIIGDFGYAGSAEGDVAAMVASWAPDAVLTVGDNNYPLGEAATIDQNVGQYYGSFIHPYRGVYGPGASVNRFFPALGNHDWETQGAQPLLDWFDLPGNERYYDVVIGRVHVFVVDSDPREPDGIDAASTQANWLRTKLAASSALWRIVTLHHPPYSSGKHGSSLELRWPFREWGADIVLSGHDHSYERSVVDGLPYVVNGLGGAEKYAIGVPLPESEVGYDDDFGAMHAEFGDTLATFSFQTRRGGVIDRFTLARGGFPRAGTGRTLIPGGARWRYLDLGLAPESTWTQPDYDDDAWAEGAAPLGYGDPDLATTLAFGTSPAAKHLTTWFRRSFTAPAGASRLWLRMSRDDGAAVSLNGVEIWRTNLPAGVIAPTTRASSAITNEYEPRFIDTLIDASALRAGANVLAVELHQAAPNSSDLRFDLELREY